MLASGTSVGRYVVFDRLGEGAMGEVYRAWDHALDRIVALKIMLPMRAESASARKRFLREARLTARINHPCVAHIYDVGEYDEVPFIAMEFVPGRTLRLEMEGPVPPPRVVLLARQILEGLAEAHRQGVIHRDLKPENIIISGRDQVKILDFGLAKPLFEEASELTDLSNTGLTGTPRYMAPEQIQGQPVDARTDLYALGAVLYELVAGRPVHGGATLGEMLLSVVHRPAPLLTPDMCPPALAQAIGRALAKPPAERFADADAMKAALLDLDASGEATPRVPAPHLPHPRAEMYTRRARDSLTGVGSASSLSLEMIEQALELDPDYALAHAVHAEACAAAFCTGQVDARWLDRAQASLDRAEGLDPALPDLRVARARLVWNKAFNFPAETALRELRLALRKDPEHVGALRLWATITGHVGLFDVADAAVAKLRALDPTDPLALAVATSIKIARGHFEQAVEELAPVLRLDPRHEDALSWWMYGHAQLLLGDHAAAEEALAHSLARRPSDPLLLSLSALIRALASDPRGARQLARSAEREIRSELHPHHAYHLLACAESVLGDARTALFWLRRAGDDGMPCWPWFVRDPFLVHLRQDPDGEAYVESLRRRHEFYVREFARGEARGDLSFVATLVS